MNVFKLKKNPPTQPHSPLENFQKITRFSPEGLPLTKYESSQVGDVSLISSGQDWANIYWNIDRYFLQILILRLAHWEGLSPLQRPWPDWKREVPANLHHGKLLSPFTLATATYLSPISTISNSCPISPFSHYILSVPYFTLLYPPFTFSSASASTDAMWYLEIFIFVAVSL